MYVCITYQCMKHIYSNYSNLAALLLRQKLAAWLLHSVTGCAASRCVSESMRFSERRGRMSALLQECWLLGNFTLWLAVQPLAV